MNQADLGILYRQVILDHAKKPHHFRTLPASVGRQVEKFNPSCGDVLQVRMVVLENQIQDMSFDGAGCAISLAAASMLTEQLIGQSLPAARKKLAAFSELLTADQSQGQDQGGLLTGESQSVESEDGQAQDVDLGELSALAGVRQFPTRLKCATLASHAATDLIAKIEGE
ncbi:Fe-S cluster assembly sulfur transfer protein SufU [Fructobacillus evanidus]|uniref:NifU family (IscU) n=1 Tax=Fructobacillus evanidus TaxID=3064281 RepID=A0ABM9MQQ0_9LACO|nr:Fe-S cluster assembly scaffold protein IscU [Fructobacillus sp. LMG 32999]CAK1232319.1 Fe-S cluster assembly scaffold protein IscU [Fructobacillus sp. LMG 32999]CAK1232324.1 Fe-S cluster assembly scaffold protein IscU [Fructobacillus sp. LMG 32999]CAK1236315.1 Fe-S cluster assembly scaffold protein IscU [Fructobacillus sp. LMG 32999]CAK1238184.1 Fe-S cluster assembly scaffold protein IscU [Fructobacillus sp. LMG 32999]